MNKIFLQSPYFVRTILINIYGFVLYRRRFSGSFYKWLSIYKQNLKKTPQEIQEEQLKLLKEQLIYNFENIPYYKKVFDEVNFNPYEIKSIIEIKKIPFLTKEIIRKEFDNLYNKKIPSKKYILHTTSGSTGEKLKFLLPKELYYKKNTAFMYRFYDFYGIQPMDRRVTIGGRIFTKRPPFWIYNRFENQLLLSAHHLNSNTVDLYLNKIEKFNPVFIQGHPSAILIIARHIIEKKYVLKAKIKAIFTTGETLLKEDKLLIQEAFHSTVAQQYGSGECCFSAQETKNDDGYSINYEHGFIELIDSESENLKEVVVTSLQNDVMPFVRYKIGDFVVPTYHHYSQEYNLPILFNEVIGRVDDVLYDENGNSILPVTLRMNIKPLLFHNTNYQLIQTAPTTFELRLIDNDKKIKISDFEKLLKRLLGNSISINVNYVNSLTSLGGKIRNIICNK